MQTLQFKTNINCSGCVAKVTPAMNTTTGIKKWTVNIEDPKKTLTIETDSLTAGEIIKTVNTAGFKIEELIN